MSRWQELRTNLSESIRYHMPSLEDLAAMIPNDWKRALAAGIIAVSPVIPTYAAKASGSYDPSLANKVQVVTLQNSAFPSGKLSVEVPTEEARNQYLTQTTFIPTPALVETARPTDINTDTSLTGYQTSVLPPSYVPQMDLSENPRYPFIGQKAIGSNLWLVDITSAGQVVPALTSVNFADYASMNWQRQRITQALIDAGTGNYSSLLTHAITGEDNQDRTVAGVVLVPGDYLHSTSGNFAFTAQPGTVFVMTSQSSDNDSVQPGYTNLVDLSFGGSLSLNGTPQNPIIFTSNSDAPEMNDWGSIANFGAASLQYTLIEFANTGIQSAGDLTMYNNIVRNTQSGISALGNSAIISANELHNNQNGIYAGAQSMSIDNNLIYNNPLIHQELGLAAGLVLGSVDLASLQAYSNIIMTTGLGIQALTSQNPNIDFDSNIVIANQTGIMTSPYGQGATIANNDVWANTVNFLVDGAETHDFDASNMSHDPQFRNPVIGDFAAWIPLNVTTPTLSLDPAEYNVNGGERAILTATLSTLSPLGAVTAMYTIQPGTATAGQDYIDGTGIVTIPAGALQAQIPIQTLNDGIAGTESFGVSLANLIGATAGNISATVSIYNQGQIGPATIGLATASPFSVVEGQSISIPVIRSGSTAGDSQIAYLIAAGSRQLAVSGTLDFPPGTTTQNITYAVPDDNIYQRITELLPITLSNPTNASLGLGTGFVSVEDNDPLPRIYAQHSRVQANEADGIARIVLDLSNPSAEPVQIDVKTHDGVNAADGSYQGAKAANNDYVPVNTTMTIPAYASSANVDIQIPNDDFYELPKMFRLSYTNARGAYMTTNIGSVSVLIKDDDSMPSADFAQGLYAANEGSTLDIPVRISKPAGPGNTVELDVRTYDGAARAGNDYTAIDQHLVFTGDQTEQIVKLHLSTDNCKEPLEDLTLRLGNPKNVSLGTANNPMTVIIKDVYTPPTSPPFGCYGGPLK